MRSSRAVAVAVDAQRLDEGRLWDLDRADLLHASLAFLLTLQQFALSRDVTAVALGRDVLALGLDRFPRDDARSDSRLNRHVEELAWDQFPQAFGHGLSVLVGLVAMNDRREGIDRLRVEQHVDAHELRRLHPGRFVVE